jgi:hypothetical protein
MQMKETTMLVGLLSGLMPGMQPETSLSEILYEQLGHLIQYADQEPDRFQRVKSILMETFN